MGMSLDQSLRMLYRVKGETLSYLATMVYDKRSHDWAMDRMQKVHQSKDYQALPRWAQAQVAGYEEGYFAGVQHLHEWRYLRTRDQKYIPESEVVWGERAIEGGAYFWKGTDLPFYIPPPVSV